jgi:hypothetical protein
MSPDPTPGRVAGPRPVDPDALADENDRLAASDPHPGRLAGPRPPERQGFRWFLAAAWK